MWPAKIGTDKHSVSKQIDSSLLIVSSVPALYQRIFSGAANYHELGTRILQQIKTAHAFRQVEVVRELARLLANIPIRECQLIAQYYLVWCKCTELEYYPEILERIAEQTQTYKAQALISRAALDVYQGKVEPALYFYMEALKANPSISDFIRASVGIALIKSMEGFNTLAVEDLERLIPMLHHSEPLPRLTFMNAYAVELSETGRLTEAQAVSLRAMSSPLARFYREPRETLWEIRSRHQQQSTIAFTKPKIEQTYEPEIAENVIRRERVNAAIDFMQANIHRSIALPELAKAVSLSGSHFSRLFRVETGISPGAYLIRLRLEKAAKLLATTFLSVKEIMVAVGYGNRHNFLRQFKREFQATPTTYRSRFFSRR